MRKKVIGTATLYLADCMDVLPSLEVVHAVVTDPPYGIGFMYNGKKEVATTPEKFWSWYSGIHATYCERLLPGGFCAVWHSGTYHRYLWDWYGADIRIYIAAKNFVQLRKTAINHAYDPVVFFYKSGQTPLRPSNPPRNLDFSVGNTAGIISDRTRLEKKHPTPRPLDQVEHIVKNFTCDGAVVLDPFMGSGTTGVACAKNGRAFIGIEAEPLYFDIACERIRQQQASLGNIKIDANARKGFIY